MHCIALLLGGRGREAEAEAEAEAKAKTKAKGHNCIHMAVAEADDFTRLQADMQSPCDQ
jgi:hypothetical protein